LDWKLSPLYVAEYLYLIQELKDRSKKNSLFSKKMVISKQFDCVPVTTDYKTVGCMQKHHGDGELPVLGES
jgi:hypothetical protein